MLNGARPNLRAIWIEGQRLSESEELVDGDDTLVPNLSRLCKRKLANDEF
jgi:hypothetical protein